MSNRLEAIVRSVLSRARAAQGTWAEQVLALPAAALARVSRLPVPARAQRFAERRLLPGAQRAWSRLRPLAAFIEARLREAAREPRGNGKGAMPQASAAVVLEDLVDQAQHGSSWQARVSAVSGLADFHDDTALTSLIAALHDPSVEVASSAVDSLAGHRGPRARGALRDVIDDARGYFHPLTRAAAVLALARGEDASDQARVREAVRDAAAEVSLAAITAIAGQRSPANLEALHGVADDETGYFLPTVRMAARQALEGVR